MSNAATGNPMHPDLLRFQGYADFFRLASMFFLSPSEELAQGVIDGSVFDDMRAIFEDAGLDPSCAAFAHESALRRENPTASEMRTELRRDYTALFTHPERPLVAICEMRFRDGRDCAETPSTPFLNEAALHAESCYRAAGLSLDGSRSREPGDHLAIELEFMAYLNARLAEALERNDLDAHRRWEEALSEFEPHLTSWVPDFFSACEHSGCGTVYPWLGRIGAVFMERYLEDRA